MRALVLCVLTVGSLSPVFLVVTPANAAAPQRDPRSLALALEAPIATQVEALLAAPNTLLVTDYYYVDTRFGPNLRIDAVIVEAIGSPTRAKGLRVQVRDKENRIRQEGTSYMDLDELTTLSRALTSMAELAEKWTGHTIAGPLNCLLPAKAGSGLRFASRRACRGRISRRDSWIRSPHQSTSVSSAR